MQTNDLIQQLANKTSLVHFLPSTPVRLAKWLAISVPAVLAMLLIMPPRPDLAQKLAEPRFLIEELAALATCLAAAVAALSIGVPGSSRRFLWLPVLPLLVWFLTLGHGCVSSWLRLGPDGLRLTPEWECLPVIMMTGAIPAIAMALMIRRGAPLMPRTTVALGALAAAALANVALRLFHSQDASLMVLVWQFGTVAMVTVLGGGIGNSLLHWRRESL